MSDTAEAEQLFLWVTDGLVGREVTAGAAVDAYTLALAIFISKMPKAEREQVLAEIGLVLRHVVEDELERRAPPQRPKPRLVVSNS